MKFKVNEVGCNECGHHIIDDLSASVASMDIYMICPICESTTEIHVAQDETDEDEYEEDEDESDI